MTAETIMALMIFGLFALWGVLEFLGWVRRDYLRRIDRLYKRVSS